MNLIDKLQIAFCCGKDDEVMGYSECVSASSISPVVLPPQFTKAGLKRAHEFIVHAWKDFCFLGFMLAKEWKGREMEKKKCYFHVTYLTGVHFLILTSICWSSVVILT